MSSDFYCTGKGFVIEGTVCPSYAMAVNLCINRFCMTDAEAANYVNRLHAEYRNRLNTYQKTMAKGVKVYG